MWPTWGHIDLGHFLPQESKPRRATTLPPRSSWPPTPMTARDKKIQPICDWLNPYLNTLKTWFKNRNLFIFPAKSSAAVFTTWSNDCSIDPQLTFRTHAQNIIWWNCYPETTSIKHWQGTHGAWRRRSWGHVDLFSSSREPTESVANMRTYSIGWFS